MSIYGAAKFMCSYGAIIRVVKLQKHKAYTYKTDAGHDIEHYKHTINIPEDTINKLGWSSGMDLAVIPKGDSLVIKPGGKKGDTSNSSSR